MHPQIVHGTVKAVTHVSSLELPSIKWPLTAGGVPQYVGSTGVEGRAWAKDLCAVTQTVLRADRAAEQKTATLRCDEVITHLLDATRPIPAMRAYFQEELYPRLEQQKSQVAAVEQHFKDTTVRLAPEYVEQLAREAQEIGEQEGDHLQIWKMGAAAYAKLPKGQLSQQMKQEGAAQAQRVASARTAASSGAASRGTGKHSAATTPINPRPRETAFEQPGGQNLRFMDYRQVAAYFSWTTPTYLERLDDGSIGMHQFTPWITLLCFATDALLVHVGSKWDQVKDNRYYGDAAFGRTLDGQELTNDSFGDYLTRLEEFQTCPTALREGISKSTDAAQLDKQIKKTHKHLYTHITYWSISNNPENDPRKTAKEADRVYKTIKEREAADRSALHRVVEGVQSTAALRHLADTLTPTQLKTLKDAIGRKEGGKPTRQVNTVMYEGDTTDEDEPVHLRQLI